LFSGEYTDSSYSIYIGVKSRGYYHNNYYDLIYDVIFNELDLNGNYMSTLMHLPICEPAYTKGYNRIFYDISGSNNHATGTVYNSGSGRQNEYHYLQNGFLIKNGQYIPILKDKSAFADGSPLDSEGAYLQDEKSYLNTYSTKLQVLKYPSLQQADKDTNIWYDGIDNNYPPKLVNHYNLNKGFNENKKTVIK
jgi:hypothetical protein